MAVLYDPPSGWRYGFPKPYLPAAGEPLELTLIRDGYPAKDAEFGARYCRFIGERDELEAMAQRHVDGDNDPARDHPADYCASEVRNNSEQDHDDESLLTPEEEAEIVADINSGRWPYLLPVSNDNLPAQQPVAAQAQPAGITLHYESATRNRGPYITTYSGRFYPFDPRPEDVCIEDIIHSLSVMQRYTGHGRKPYSVAEHSVHIYRWLVAQNADLETRLAGLLHDAPEALSGFGDVARPAKKRAPLIGSTERAIWERAVAPRFELPLMVPEIAHEADTRICADEMAQNLHEVDPILPEPLGVQLEFWDVDRAKAEFWRAFYQVQCQRQQEVGKRRAA